MSFLEVLIFILVICLLFFICLASIKTINNVIGGNDSKYDINFLKRKLIDETKNISTTLKGVENVENINKQTDIIVKDLIKLSKIYDKLKNRSLTYDDILDIKSLINIENSINIKLSNLEQTAQGLKTKGFKLLSSNVKSDFISVIRLTRDKLIEIQIDISTRLADLTVVIRHRVENLRKESDLKLKVINELKDKIDSLKDSINSMIKHKVELNGKIRELENEIKDKNNKLEKAIFDHKRAQGQVNGLKTELADKINQLKKLNEKLKNKSGNDNKDLNHKISKLEEANKELEELNDSLKQEIKKLIEDNNKCEKINKDTTDLINDLKSKNNELSKENNELKNVNTELQLNINTLKGELEKTDHKEPLKEYESKCNREIVYVDNPQLIDMTDYYRNKINKIIINKQLSNKAKKEELSTIKNTLKHNKLSENCKKILYNKISKFR